MQQRSPLGASAAQAFWRLSRSTRVAPIGLFTPLGSRKRFSYFIASRKRVRQESQRQGRTWTSFAQGSRWLRGSQGGNHMTKPMTENAVVESSSGNVFADLGLPHAEKLRIKSGLVIEITRAINRLGLTQAEAGRRMGISQPKVSRMMRGEFANLSERKLMDCLNRLGYDIQIRIHAIPRLPGRGAPRPRVVEVAEG